MTGAPEKGAPVLSIFGGKITTARRLAVHALDDLLHFGALDQLYFKTRLFSLPEERRIPQRLRKRFPQGVEAILPFQPGSRKSASFVGFMGASFVL
mgnify:CR=1 FL=1